MPGNVSFPQRWRTARNAILSPFVWKASSNDVDDHLFYQLRASRVRLLITCMTQGTYSTIQQHNQSDVWLADESQAERVRAELARFLENPAIHALSGGQLAISQDRQWPALQPLSFFCRLERTRRSAYLGDDGSLHYGVYYYERGGRPERDDRAAPFDPSLKFEFWRYFTHALMHFSLMHILFNLLWWWYLGGAVEKRLGSGKLIVITLISALLSGYVQQKFSGPWFGGLSGVVYALMGYVWLRGERDPQSGIYLQRGLIIFALIWIVAGWFDLFGMSMANGAHIAGLAVGLAMAFVDSLNARKRK